MSLPQDAVLLLAREAPHSAELSRARAVACAAIAAIPDGPARLAAPDADAFLAFCMDGLLRGALAVDTATDPGAAARLQASPTFTRAGAVAATTVDVFSRSSFAAQAQALRALAEWVEGVNATVGPACVAGDGAALQDLIRVSLLASVAILDRATAGEGWQGLTYTFPETSALAVATLAALDLQGAAGAPVRRVLDRAERSLAASAAAARALAARVPCTDALGAPGVAGKHEARAGARAAERGVDLALAARVAGLLEALEGCWPLVDTAGLAGRAIPAALLLLGSEDAWVAGAGHGLLLSIVTHEGGAGGTEGGNEGGGEGGREGGSEGGKHSTVPIAAASVVPAYATRAMKVLDTGEHGARYQPYVTVMDCQRALA